MAKLFVKLNVRLSTLLHTKLKEKNNEYYSDDHQQQKKITTIHYRKNEMKKTKLISKRKSNKKKIKSVNVLQKKQQWSRPDESIVFFSEMVGYYHGFFYQVYALCSMMIIINNSCKHVQLRGN